MNHETNDTKTESFIRNLRKLTLSPSESSAMRERLVAYADLHEVVAPAYAPSNSFSFHSLFFSRTFAMGALVVLLLIGGTGVSYAANTALPGQPLYTVKVAVNEPLEGAFITDPVAKAQWQNTLTERRLAEASSLAATNQLAPSTQTYLAQAVATHVALSQRQSDSLIAAGDVTNALAVRTDLEANLSAQVDVLALMAPTIAASGDATTSHAVLALVSDLDVQNTAVEASRIAAANSVALATSDTAASDSTNINTASTTLPIALSGSGKTTPKHTAELAYMDSQNTVLHAEETTLFKAAAAKLGLSVQATSTSSSTLPIASTTPLTSSSTNATSTQRGTITTHINQTQLLTPIVPLQSSGSH